MTLTRISSSPTRSRKGAESRQNLPGRVVLVMQGGGALGAFQAGVYQALHEAGIEPDWVVHLDRCNQRRTDRRQCAVIAAATPARFLATHDATCVGRRSLA